MVALSGCATLKPDERALLLEHNVSPETFDRMRYNEPLTVPDIIELSKRGVPVPFIIHYLRRTETSYPLSPSDITELKNAGVSPDVVNYLLATPSIYSPQRYPYPYYGNNILDSCHSDGRLKGRDRVASSLSKGNSDFPTPRGSFDELFQKCRFGELPPIDTSRIFDQGKKVRRSVRVKNDKSKPKCTHKKGN